MIRDAMGAERDVVVAIETDARLYLILFDSSLCVALHCVSSHTAQHSTAQLANAHQVCLRACIILHAVGRIRHSPHVNVSVSYLRYVVR
jgi:hypothetical protein